MTMIDIEKKRKSRSLLHRSEVHGIDALLRVQIGDTHIEYRRGMQVGQDLLMHTQTGRVSTTQALYYTLSRMLLDLVANEDDRYELEIHIKKGLAANMKSIHHHSIRHYITQSTPSPTLPQTKRGRQDA